MWWVWRQYKNEQIKWFTLQDIARFCIQPQYWMPANVNVGLASMYQADVGSVEMVGATSDVLPSYK